MSWEIYHGTGTPQDEVPRLPDPPPWRKFEGEPALRTPAEASLGRGAVPNERHRAVTYQPDSNTVELVNTALYLRRPLLVTGQPGTGKSTLAYAIAHELNLGPVLHWPITSRSTLHDGLYQYDPLSRLYAVGAPAFTTSSPGEDDDLGRYLRLGPLGTALLPFENPRVLLIDEIDKSDLDLPNDLLTIFEKGEYEIPELVRVAESQAVCAVPTADGFGRVSITNGLVQCRAFPLVVMTSNAEREFPPAFLRRCVSLRLAEPGRDQLVKIVRAHLGDLADSGLDLVDQFLSKREIGDLATDQLLSAIYLVHHAQLAEESPENLDREGLADTVLSFLSSESGFESDLTEQIFQDD